MQSTADWLQLFGYLFLLVAALYGLYQLLPTGAEPTPAAGASAPPRRAEREEPARDLLEWAELAARAEGYDVGHAARVADLAVRLGEAVGASAGERKVIETAALLHDVGMLEGSKSLWLKAERLSQRELFELYRHSARGALKALAISGSQPVSQTVRWHHERWDGLGYPDGLDGETIPRPARILRLADSFEAMRQVRPYRQALTADEAVAEIHRLAGVVFDPQLAQVFLDVVVPAYLAEQEGLWG